MSGRRRTDAAEEAPAIGRTHEAPESSRRAEARRLRKGRHSAPRKTPERPAFYTGLLIASVAVLVGLLLAAVGRLSAWDAFRRERAADRTDTLAAGITIDGAPVGGDTRQKAAALLRKPGTPDGLEFEYRIHADGRTWVMTQADLPLGSDLDAVIAEGWSLSRRLTLAPGETVDSPLAARGRLRAQIAHEGASLSSMTGYDVKDIARYVEALAGEADRGPVEAQLLSVDFSRRDFTFSDDIAGLRLDREKLAADIAGLLNAGVTDADIEAPVEEVPAAITRLRLKNTFGCLEVRSFSTMTPDGDRQVRDFVTALNGTIIPSGQTVSLRGVLGEAGDEDANADGFASALFSAGVCAGMQLVERAPQEDAETKLRGLEARLDAGSDLRLRNEAKTPLCVLCYYTPMNGRGTRGSVTLEVYGLLRQGGETAELEARVTRTLPAGTPEYQVDPELEPGTQLLRREARDGAEVDTVLVIRVNGRTFSSEVICSAVYPPVCRLIETGP